VRNAEKILWTILLVIFASGCHSHKVKKMKDAGESAAQVAPAQEIYEKGVAELKKNRPASARKCFDQVSLREDSGEYKELAAVGTADTYFVDNSVDSWTEAISRYQTFLAFHPTHPKAAYCQYRIAECYMKEMGSPDRDTSAAKSASQSLESVIENYPKSDEAQQAKAKVKEVKDVLAAHEIKVGDFYLKNGHPRGAVERYRSVLEKYPDYWNLPLLYYRLGEALYRDNNGAEAVIYFRKVVEGAPGTNLSKQADRRLTRIEKGQTAYSKRGRAENLKSEPLVKPKKDKHWWQFWK
jgi:outer membrane protein assembly factor BamD